MPLVYVQRAHAACRAARPDITIMLSGSGLTGEAMEEDGFLSLPAKHQSSLLLKMAKDCLFLLEGYAVPHLVCKRSLQICDEYLNGSAHPAELVGLYLDHPDPDYFDLTAQLSFVGDDTDAYAAVDLAVYATGFIARQAYLDQGLDHMPDPILFATPDNAAYAIGEYRKLLDRRALPRIQ